jgi:hypothetical protein
MGFVLVLSLPLLSACAGGEPTQAVEEAVSSSYTSEVLDASYKGALSASNQLMLGTLLLEETEHAITPEQATTLLPLWRALQGGGVAAQVEIDAVLKQIEGAMTQGQLQAIAAMQLTQEDMRAWMEEQGMAGGGPGPGAGGPGGDKGGRGPGENMSDEEREALRATMEAGGGFPGGGAGGEMPPEMATRQAEMANMSDEEREAFRATMEAGGGRPGRPGGSGSGGQTFGFLLGPLMELLEERAGEG